MVESGETRGRVRPPLDIVNGADSGNGGSREVVCSMRGMIDRGGSVAAAEAMRRRVKPLEPEQSWRRRTRPSAGKVVLATVKGRTVHDMGKRTCRNPF